MRCLTLARALRKAGAECRFVTRKLPGHMGEQIASEGFRVDFLPPPKGPTPKGPPEHAVWAGVDWMEDAIETRALLGDAINWLVVDHYAFDKRWEMVAQPVDTRLMVIDDLADRPHSCDLLLDQNLGHTCDNYGDLVPDHCQLLLGPQNSLLRPEFAELRTEAIATRKGRNFRSLLISMGGVDHVDATSTVLASLRKCQLPPATQICVVMGGRAPALKRVQEMARSMPRPTEVAIDVRDMAMRMAQADLAIGAGGTTTWERCCLGLPSIIIEVAKNQAGIVDAMAKAGAGFKLDRLNSPSFGQSLIEAVTIVNNPARLDAMSEAASAICDGYGVDRVISCLCST